MDILISAEVLLPQGEELQVTKVPRLSLDDNDQVVGVSNNHPLLNSLVYGAEFPDGAVKKYAANMIAKNVLSQVDPDGFSTNVVSLILDHRRDDMAVHMYGKYK